MRAVLHSTSRREAADRGGYAVNSVNVGTLFRGRRIMCGYAWVCCHERSPRAMSVVMGVEIHKTLRCEEGIQYEGRCTPPSQIHERSIR